MISTTAIGQGHPWVMATLTCHVPLLCFQESALKRVRRDFLITNKDFEVLAAGYMIQQNNYLRYFDCIAVTKTCVGVFRMVVYDSVKRLKQRGLITVKEMYKTRPGYQVTEMGLKAISCFTRYFNYTVLLYRDNLGEYPFASK